MKWLGTSTPSGGQRKTTESGRAKEKERKAKKETDTQARTDSKENAAPVKKYDAGQANATRRRLTFRSKGKNNIHQVEEDSTCALEDVEEGKNDASKSTTSKITKTPVTGLTPAIMLKQCEEIMANLKESAKQRNEVHEQRGSSSSEQREGGSG